MPRLSVLNLDSTYTALLAANFDMDDPQTYHDSTAVSVYDSLGNSHTLQTFYVKTAPGTWNVFASLDGAAAFTPTPNTLTFDTSGAIDTTATTLPLSVGPLALTTGAANLSFTLGFSGTTQFGSAFSVNALDQDGYTSARLSGFGIDDDGVIQGRYTNGQSAVLGQVVLANFANPNGLQPLGRSSKVTVNCELTVTFSLGGGNKIRGA